MKTKQSVGTKGELLNFLRLKLLEGLEEGLKGKRMSVIFHVGLDSSSLRKQQTLFLSEQVQGRRSGPKSVCGGGGGGGWG